MTREVRIDDGSEGSERRGRRGWSLRHTDESPPRQYPGQARDRRGSPSRPQSPRRGTEEGSPLSQSPRSSRRVRARSPRRHSPERQSPRRHSPERQSPRRHSPERQSPRRHSPERQSPRRHSPERQSPGRHLPRPQNRRHASRDHSPRRNDNKHADHDQSPGRVMHEQTLVSTPTNPSRQARGSKQRSPQKAQSGHNPGLGGYTRGRQHKQGEYRYPSADLEGEATTARLEVFSIVLHILVAGSALAVIIPMAMVTTRWETERKRCPLFVDKPPGFDYRWGWGNPDMTSCKVAAFLPIIMLVLSVTLLLFHSGLLHIWRIKEEPPAFAFTRIYTLVVLAIVALETLLALCVAVVLTEGFRHTCISFDLNLSWNEYVPSCQKNFADRDEAYLLDQLHTFAKIIVALASAWFCAITAILLTIVYITRSKICSCELVCI
ncbi:uncharacterized protein [Procambarus clarkii]|uniref:uncharacterized protein n=1 Tax=Procambarus clarkii TaxID=6728 RepID=UPI001E676FF7|nr:uncharacterized protein LOC123758032 [Procambarus clarkii]XP_045598161.1 uncharacterized protein LOC123758032 [Procambarus clarkii]